MDSIDCLSFRAKPSNNPFSFVSVLKLNLYLIPKLKIRNPKFLPFFINLSLAAY